MRKQKLLNCPFCGGEAENIKRNSEYPYIHAVWCPICHCRTSFETTTEEAIKAWNTRKPMEDIVQELEVESDEQRKRANLEVKIGSFGTMRNHIYAIEVLENVIKIVKGGTE